ncbi:hypothetical protein F4W70_01335 [Pseudomonas cannabina]|nr:hypothetical protein F4W70_01335 [Pseudomonas cannabina]
MSPKIGLLPVGRGSGPGDVSFVREGLRSGPEFSCLGCVWHTEAVGFAAGSRQFADKSAPTTSEGLRSGPEFSCLGCVWHTEAVGFAAGSRQFADKSATTSNRSLTSEGLRSGPETGHIDCA